MAKADKKATAMVPINATAMVPASITGSIQQYDDDTFKEMAAASQAFLPRIQLCGANSDVVKEGKAPMGHYAIIEGDNITPIGDEVDTLVFAWQPRAMDVSDTDSIITVLDHASDEFKRIQEQSTVQDSGCMWGFEFLLYLYEAKRFVTFFMASKTARREAPNLKGLVSSAATLKSKLIKKGRYTWHGPVVIPNSTPPSEMPTDAEMQEAAKKFRTLGDTDTETVTEPPSGRET